MSSNGVAQTAANKSVLDEIVFLQTLAQGLGLLACAGFVVPGYLAPV